MGESSTSIPRYLRLKELSGRVGKKSVRARGWEEELCCACFLQPPVVTWTRPTPDQVNKHLSMSRGGDMRPHPCKRNSG